MNRIGQKASLQQLYDVIETMAPDKVAKNQWYKEKVRQTVNQIFTKVEKGVYTNMTININCHE